MKAVALSRASVPRGSTFASQKRCRVDWLINCVQALAELASETCTGYCLASCAPSHSGPALHVSSLIGFLIGAARPEVSKQAVQDSLKSVSQAGSTPFSLLL